MSYKWSRNARYLALLLVLILFGALLYAARILLGPLLIAALLAYILNPLVTVVNRRSHLPRSIVVALLYLLSLALLVVLVAVFVQPLIAQAEAVTLELQEISTYLQSRLSERVVVLGFEVDADNLLEQSDALPSDFIRSDRLVRVLEAASTNLVWILVILVTTYYLLQDWDRLREWLFNLAPPQAQADLRRLYAEVKIVWQSYVRGQLVLMALMALFTGLILTAVGLPGAAAIGLLTGLFDAIPTIGPTIAMIAAGLVAWFEGSTYLPLSNAWFALVVIGLHTLVQAVENVWLRPQIMGRSVQIHPAVVFIGIIAALSMVGALGALVVVPVLGTTAVIGGYLRRRILGLEPWPLEEDETPVTSN